LFSQLGSDKGKILGDEKAKKQFNKKFDVELIKPLKRVWEDRTSREEWLLQRF
jgi:hypothetical protein